eukprot:TRINITY_DN5990_c0_g1_i1.p1 TRINITY_DN5990_c0_g1~~TRINITY_DN5990_c0_g1_i1.p1  ORF type:complete len:689 (+),score=146.34 TRINITY_DN5990_c0_g1_i1:293-2359(+)
MHITSKLLRPTLSLSHEKRVLWSDLKMKFMKVMLLALVGVVLGILLYSAIQHRRLSERPPPHDHHAHLKADQDGLKLRNDGGAGIGVDYTDSGARTDNVRRTSISDAKKRDEMTRNAELEDKHKTMDRKVRSASAKLSTSSSSSSNPSSSSTSSSSLAMSDGGGCESPYLHSMILKDSFAIDVVSAGGQEYFAATISLINSTFINAAPDHVIRFHIIVLKQKVDVVARFYSSLFGSKGVIVAKQGCLYDTGAVGTATSAGRTKGRYNIQPSSTSRSSTSSVRPYPLGTSINVVGFDEKLIRPFIHVVKGTSRIKDSLNYARFFLPHLLPGPPSVVDNEHSDVNKRSVSGAVEISDVDGRLNEVKREIDQLRTSIHHHMADDPVRVNKKKRQADERITSGGLIKVSTVVRRCIYLDPDMVVQADLLPAWAALGDVPSQYFQASTELYGNSGAEEGREQEENREEVVGVEEEEEGTIVVDHSRDFERPLGAVPGSRRYGGNFYWDNNEGHWLDFVDRQESVFNAGFLVADLDRWRTSNCTGQLMDWMRLNYDHTLWKYGSQSPMLLVFHKNYVRMSDKWNFDTLGYTHPHIRHRDITSARILHWSGGKKPWAVLRQNATKSEKAHEQFVAYWFPYYNSEEIDGVLAEMRQDEVTVEDVKLLTSWFDHSVKRGRKEMMAFYEQKKYVPTSE